MTLRKPNQYMADGTSSLLILSYVKSYFQVVVQSLEHKVLKGPREGKRCDNCD
jgi:hypothetical protein